MPEVGEQQTKRVPAFGGYLSGTEAIRGTLCMLVVAYHCYLYSSPTGAPSQGWIYNYFISRWQLALPVFFMLSAFLLYRPFCQSILLGRKRPSFGAYLANRVLRIFPAYWAILALAAVLGLTVVWVPKHDFAFHLPTLLANAFLVHPLHPSGIQTGVPPSWSLAVEWIFYLLLPLAVIFALRFGGRSDSVWKRRVALLIPAAALYLVSIVSREVIRRHVDPSDPAGVLNTWYAVAEKSFFQWNDLFALGMVLAVLRVEFEAGRLRLRRGWRPAALGGWVAISVVATWASATGRIDFHQYLAVMTPALALFLAAVVLFSGDAKRDPLMRILNFKPFVWLGDRSLSIYLLHYPVIVFFVLQGGVFQSGWAGYAFNVGLVSAVVVALGYLSYRFIEYPAIVRKVRTTVPGPPPLEPAVLPASPQPELARA